MNEPVRAFEPSVAVLLPCYNEAVAIGATVEAFRRALPGARIYVYDNNSTDGTFETAQRAGASARRERTQGKGAVVRRMFADIDADVYVLCDGDDTYDAAAAAQLVERLSTDRLDMITGVRRETDVAAYRPGHRFGNQLLTGLVRWVFNAHVADMLSGYRVLSRRFVKSFPAQATGFGIETEMTVHALQLLMPTDEIVTAYKERPPNSMSKLRTYRDGWRILMLIVTLAKEERPLWFFGIIGVVLAVLAIGLSIPLFIAYFETGLVLRQPTAILTTGLMLLAWLSFVCGLILDTVTRGRWELKRLHYLTLTPPGTGG
ncbi:MAG: glycosyltransferase family 2 protein [Proteobacteria bacterium]|nr:glycosyltransferase family 2 protein [Pseudomonadota bacterium]